MSKTLSLSLTVLLPAIALAGGEPAGPTIRAAVVAANPWTLGSPLPRFTGQDLADPKRALIGLERFKGQAVLVNLWASWCSPCVAELPALAKLDAQLAPKGLEIVGISLDDRFDEAEMIAGDLDLKYTVLFDPAHVSTDLWHAATIPATFLYDRSGRLVWRHSGILRLEDPGFKAALDQALATH